MEQVDGEVSMHSQLIAGAVLLGFLQGQSVQAQPTSTQADAKQTASENVQAKLVPIAELRQAAMAEVRRIQLTIRLNEQEQEKLLAEVAKLVKDFSGKRPEGESTELQIHRDLRGQIRKQAASLVGLARYAKYRLDRVRKNSLFESTGTDAVVCTLDLLFGLDDGQRTKLEQSLHDEWESEWSGFATEYGYSAHLVSRIPQDVLQGILNTKQLADWEKTPALQRPFGEVPQIVSGDADVRKQEFDRAALVARTKCQLLIIAAANLQIEMIDRVCKLNEKQKSRLRVAAKGAAMDAVNRFLDLLEIRSRTFGDEQDFYQLQSSTAGPILLSFTRWNRLVRSTLNPDQLPKYDALHHRRVEANHLAIVWAMAFSFAEEGKLNTDQIIDLAHLLGKKIPKTPSVRRLSRSTYEGLCSLTFKELAPIVGEATARSFLGMLQGIKGVLEAEVGQQKLDEVD